MKVKPSKTTRTTAHQTDEWGEPIGRWKTIIDFREINPNGVPVEEVLAALHKLNMQDQASDRQNRKVS